MDVEESDDLVQPGPSSSSNEPDEQTFDRNTCFICEKSVKNKGHKHGDYSMRVHTVSRPSVKERLMAILKERKDPGPLRILASINNVDLVAMQARYHFSCVRNLVRQNDGAQEKKGRSPSPVDDAMQYIFNYLEEQGDSCQFTIAHLMDQIPGERRPHEKTVIERLLAKYGDEILTFNVRGAGTVICFKDTGRLLLSEAWYSSRSTDSAEEKKRVVREAGAVVREEIRSKLYSIDQYPASTDFMEGAEEDVTECLSIFLKEVILPRKRKTSIPFWEKQVTFFAHAIIKATRPRCFLSTVLLGVGCFLKKKISSRFLVDTLAAIGFSCSYSEVELLELSCISRQQPVVLPSGFSQWVADNADFNMNTLDGRGSWHVMALIQCVTPASSVQTEGPVPRNY